MMAGRAATVGRRPETDGINADVMIMNTDGSHIRHVTRTVLYDSLGPARVLAGHRGGLGQGGGRPSSRTVPVPPAVPLAVRRRGDRPALAGPALPPYWHYDLLQAC
jgi:hypothetical protein